MRLVQCAPFWQGSEKQSVIEMDLLERRLLELAAICEIPSQSVMSVDPELRVFTPSGQTKQDDLPFSGWK